MDKTLVLRAKGISRELLLYLVIRKFRRKSSSNLILSYFIDIDEEVYKIEMRKGKIYVRNIG